MNRRHFFARTVGALTAAFVATPAIAAQSLPWTHSLTGAFDFGAAAAWAVWCRREADGRITIPATTRLDRFAEGAILFLEGPETTQVVKVRNTIHDRATGMVIGLRVTDVRLYSRIRITREMMELQWKRNHLESQIRETLRYQTQPRLRIGGTWA